MNVYALDVTVAADASGGVKRALRQNQAVGGNDQHIGTGIFKCDERFFGLFRSSLYGKRNRRQDGNVVRQSHFFDGRGLELHAAAARTIGLSENKTDLVPGVNQGAQGGSSKGRGAGKSNTHRNS